MLNVQWENYAYNKTVIMSIKWGNWWRSSATLLYRHPAKKTVWPTWSLRPSESNDDNQADMQKNTMCCFCFFVFFKPISEANRRQRVCPWECFPLRNINLLSSNCQAVWLRDTICTRWIKHQHLLISQLLRGRWCSVWESSWRSSNPVALFCSRASRGDWLVVEGGWRCHILLGLGFGGGGK